jgi:hypothetical protein
MKPGWQPRSLAWTGLPCPDEGKPRVPSELKKTEKEKQVVVSVRFPAQLLDRIQAIAAVQSTTANAVIRAGMDAYVRERVASPEFRAASEEYVAQAQAHVAAALKDHDTTSAHPA